MRGSPGPAYTGATSAAFLARFDPFAGFVGGLAGGVSGKSLSAGPQTIDGGGDIPGLAVGASGCWAGGPQDWAMARLLPTSTTASERRNPFLMGKFPGFLRLGEPIRGPISWSHGFAGARNPAAVLPSSSSVPASPGVHPTPGAGEDSCAQRNDGATCSGWNDRSLCYDFPSPLGASHAPSPPAPLPRGARGGRSVANGAPGPSCSSM